MRDHAWTCLQGVGADVYELHQPLQRHGCLGHWTFHMSLCAQPLTTTLTGVRDALAGADLVSSIQTVAEVGCLLHPQLKLVLLLARPLLSLSEAGGSFGLVGGPVSLSPCQLSVSGSHPLLGLHHQSFESQVCDKEIGKMGYIFVDFLWTCSEIVGQGGTASTPSISKDRFPLLASTLAASLCTIPGSSTCCSSARASSSLAAVCM